MLTKRIIPCLDVDAGRVVKGVTFSALRDAGDPVELAALYNREGADELVFYDITASSQARGIILDDGRDQLVPLEARRRGGLRPGRLARAHAGEASTVRGRRTGTPRPSRYRLASPIRIVP